MNKKYSICPPIKPFYICKCFRIFRSTSGYKRHKCKGEYQLTEKDIKAMNECIAWWHKD